MYTQCILVVIAPGVFFLNKYGTALPPRHSIAIFCAVTCRSIDWEYCFNCFFLKYTGRYIKKYFRINNWCSNNFEGKQKLDFPFDHVDYVSHVIVG